MFDQNFRQIRIVNYIQHVFMVFYIINLACKLSALSWSTEKRLKTLRLSNEAMILDQKVSSEISRYTNEGPSFQAVQTQFPDHSRKL